MVGQIIFRNTDTESELKSIFVIDQGKLHGCFAVIHLGENVEIFVSYKVLRKIKDDAELILASE
jgi:hypothetical protein